MFVGLDRPGKLARPRGLRFRMLAAVMEIALGASHLQKNALEQTLQTTKGMHLTPQISQIVENIIGCSFPPAVNRLGFCRRNDEAIY